MAWPVIAVILVLAAIATGCGSALVGKAAEPAVSPRPVAAIAGRAVRVGHGPEGIAVDPATGLVAVATRRPGAIVLMSGTSGRVLARVRFPGEARHLAFARPGGPLLIPSEPVNRLFSLQPRSLRLTSVRVGRRPHAAASLGDRVFVSDELGRGVTVLAGGAVVARVGGFRQPGGLAATEPDVAVVDVGSYRLTLLDAGSLRPVASTAAGQGPTHVAADGRGNVYVVDTRGDAIEQFATLPRLRLRARLSLPGTPYGVALDSARARLWVTLTATNQLAEVSLTGGALQVLARYGTGRQPNTVAVDPRTGSVFVADAGDDAVQIIRPSR